MTENIEDIMQHLAVPRYAPRTKPLAIPDAAWNDTPLCCLQVNSDWVSHLLGVLTALDQQDAWEGTEDEIFAARQQVNEIMLALMPVCEPTPPAGTSFWTDEVPATTAESDNEAVNLGLKFGSTVDGNILGIRFYKSPTNSDIHFGQLYTIDGTLLDSVPFSDETSEGWQTAYFDDPVPIEAATLYIASYHTTLGQYSYDAAYFADEFDRSPLYAPASDTVDGNGCYAYDVDPAFPDQPATSNYWVDVIFEPSA